MATLLKCNGGHQLRPWAFLITHSPRLGKYILTSLTTSYLYLLVSLSSFLHFQCGILWQIVKVQIQSAGIRSKFLSRRFFPGASDCRFLNVGIGSCGPVPALFKSPGIGPGAFKPCSGVFKSVETAFMKM